MFDALIARAVAAELVERIANGRIQAVISVDDLTVGFEIYAYQARSFLLASADPTRDRIHLVSQKLRASGAPPTPFILLLKKHVDGSLVSRIEAVRHERILRIEFDHPQFGMVSLVAEMMGRLSNLILIDAAGIVLGAIKWVTPAMSRSRPVQARNLYLPPPPQAKADPLSISAHELERILQQALGEPLWQVLVRSIAGTSPLFARELAFRAAGRADASSDPALAPSLHSILAGVWQEPAIPTLAFEDDEPVAVAAFALGHLPQSKRVDSMCTALETFFGIVESYEPVKEPIRLQIEAARERLARKLAALRHQVVPEVEVERLKLSGELVLAYAADIKPGQKSLTAEMVEGQPLVIKLDPGLTPLENAQAYFSRYHRAKDAASAVPARLAVAQADLEYADQVLEDLETAEARAEIDAVISEAAEAGLLTRTTNRVSREPLSGPREYVSPEGFQVLVGRNARQNEDITFRRASAADVWLHARGVAGAHVLIVTHGREAPEGTLDFAASLAAFYSKARRERWVDVAVAPRRNVGRVKGHAARPGLVTVRDEHIVRVRPVDPTLTGSVESKE